VAVAAPGSASKIRRRTLANDPCVEHTLPL